MPRTKTYKNKARIQVVCEAEEKERLEQHVENSAYTLSEYVRKSAVLQMQRDQCLEQFPWAD
jgi:hypothetical protein